MFGVVALERFSCSRDRCAFAFCRSFSPHTHRTNAPVEPLERFFLENEFFEVTIRLARI